MLKTDPLATIDPAVFKLIQEETERQEYGLEMIPSENFVCEAILEAMGSVLTNKYAEGLPNKRYYGGCEVVDQIEDLARERAKKLFGAEYANVQVHSGATANQAVFEGLISPGDTVMGMRLDHGGHLTHGLPANFSGKHYKVVAYGVREEDGLIDYDQVAALARENKPKLIIAGASAYSRHIDFAKFREVAEEVGAFFLADIAHYAGLVATGDYPSPVEHADAVTSTTHKTLRGPRSGLILCRKKHAKPINRAVFPGLQGGPHMHTIAAKAVGFGLNLEPEFKQYSKQVISNARALCEGLTKSGLEIVSGGTDSHLLVIDLRPAEITGKEAAILLDKAGITGNMNTIPFDPQPPTVCSGLRLGTPALTTRGMKEEQMLTVAECIVRVLEARDNEAEVQKVREDVRQLSGSFPLYKHRLVSDG